MLVLLVVAYERLARASISSVVIDQFVLRRGLLSTHAHLLREVQAPVDDAQEDERQAYEGDGIGSPEEDVHRLRDDVRQSVFAKRIRRSLRPSPCRALRTATAWAMSSA